MSIFFKKESIIYLCSMIFISYPAFSDDEGRTHQFNGNSNLQLSGALYFPKDEVKINGNMSNGNNHPSCLTIIAKKIEFSGNMSLNNNNCSGVSGGNSSNKIQLVE